MKRCRRITAFALLASGFLLFATGLPCPADEARLPTPSFGRAAALWRAGDVDGALEALDRELAELEMREPPIEAWVLRAALLASAGRAAESEALWLAVAARERPLRPYALRNVISGRVGSGDTEGADEALRTLIGVDGAREHADLVLAVAEDHCDAGGHRRAAELFGTVLRHHRSGSYADAARLGRAAALEALGDAEGAVAALRSAQLQAGQPGTWSAARAAEVRICSELGREPRPFGEDEYLQMVRRLRGGSGFEAALEVLELWRTGHPGSRRADRIEAETVETLYRMRANDEALSRCLQLAQRFPDSQQLHRVHLLELRLYVRLGLTRDVARLAGELRSSGSGAPHSVRHDAGIVLAGYLVAIGDVEGGLAVYRELYRAATSAGSRRLILWRAGIAALRAGQNQRAATNLRALVALNPSGEMEPAARYWLGVAEESVGRRREALTALLWLDERYPFHYYGLRAKLMLARLADGVDAALVERLRRSVRPRDLAFPEMSISDSARRHQLFAAASLLARSGLTSEAASHLRQLLRSVPRDPALALCAARACADAGDHRRAVALLATYFANQLRRPAAATPADFWDLAYPRPFAGEVNAAAEEHGVDPHLLLALMRQESRFDPAARSAAGAIGLFQIMPYTAAEVGPRLGIGTPGEAELLTPAINSAIGAGLVADLLRRFEGYIVPAVAAYNAGEERVATWWGAGRALPDDLFVDSIPYAETRRFVREVLSNYFAYNRLYAVEGELPSSSSTNSGH